MLILFLFGQSGLKAFAVTYCDSKISSTDCASIYGDWTGWDPNPSCSDSATATQPPNSNQTTAQQIAQTFIVGFDAATPKDVITDLATKYHIGGMYVVGTHDAAAAGFTKTFYDSLNQAAGIPLLTSSDEEGAVTRYSYPPGSFPAAAQLTAKSDGEITDLVTAAGKVMASNGLTTDLAPVLDLRDVGVTGRSFSSNPDIVSDKAGAFTAGLQAAGIKPIFKHFPGFDSSTSGTTDDQKVVMTGSITNVIKPYQALISKYPNAGVMLSNMYVNALDANNPSSLSSATVKYLRTNLGFKSLITTDDLSVSSVTTKAGSLANAVSQSLQAGVDMPLFTLGSAGSVSQAEAAMDTIVGAVQNNSAAMSAVTTAQSVIQQFKGSSSTNPSGSTGCCSTGSTTLTGSDNVQMTWNFFKSQGLDDTHTAAIMGNLQIESSFNPEIIQGGGTTQDPSKIGGSTGWGLVQWTPGSKVLAIAQAFHITTPIYELATQLNIVWGQMSTSTYPPSSHWTFDAFKATTTLADAVNYFNSNFEVSADGSNDRLNAAQAALQKYGGTSEGSGGNSGQSCSNFVSPDCVSAQGTAKILCAAKAYDPASYLYGAAPRDGAAWHQQCPNIGPTCKVDCSLLVTLAVYDAFGVQLPGTDTSGERNDIGTYWQKISLSQVQAGDIVQPESGHVEVIDHISGNTLYTFGAHTDGIPQPEQVSPSSYQYNSNMLLLHYIGQGA